MSWIPVIDEIFDLAPPYDIEAEVDIVNIEEAIYTILTADLDVSTYAGTRIYPNMVPQDAEMPAITYQQISGPRSHILSGPISFAEARFQINCWSETYAEGRLLSHIVRKALNGYCGSGTGINIQSCQMDEEGDIFRNLAGVDVLRRHGKRLEFVLWFNEQLS